jgi:hypothetical protein
MRYIVIKELDAQSIGLFMIMGLGNHIYYAGWP